MVDLKPLKDRHVDIANLLHNPRTGPTHSKMLLEEDQEVLKTISVLQEKSECKHREDGMVKCTTCDEPAWDEYEDSRMGYNDFKGLK